MYFFFKFSNKDTIKCLNIVIKQESLANAKVSARQPSIGTQGHSRSFTLLSIIGRQGVVYRHVILLALSLTFPKIQPPKSPKIAVVDNPTNDNLTPRPGEPPRISAYDLYFRKLESFSYIFVANRLIVWVYLHSLAVVASQKCELEQNSAKI